MQETLQPDPVEVEDEAERNGKAKPGPRVVQRQEMIDDYIRNFFLKHGLEKSLSAFQKEWYEISQKGKVKIDEGEKIPDIKIKNQQLVEKMTKLNIELENAKVSAESAKATWDKLKKEKEYHMQHHKRVQEEKERLFKDIEKLKSLHSEYEDKYEQLKTKYEAAMKEKMLIKMERDRFLKSSQELGSTLKRLEKQDLSEDEEAPAEKAVPAKAAAAETKKNAANDSKKTNQSSNTTEALPKHTTVIPKEDASNPYLTTSFEPFPSKNVNPTRNFKAHHLAVTALVVHPRKPFIATGGDDFAWKIWSVPGGEMIIQGESHRDWISGLDFSPAGTQIATSSGDSTIKIWDLVGVKCAATFKAHAMPVYSVSYHHTGDFIVSGKLTINSRFQGSDSKVA